MRITTTHQCCPKAFLSRDRLARASQFNDYPRWWIMKPRFIPTCLRNVPPPARYGWVETGRSLDSGKREMMYTGSHPYFIELTEGAY